MLGTGRYKIKQSISSRIKFSISYEMWLIEFIKYQIVRQPLFSVYLHKVSYLINVLVVSNRLWFDSQQTLLGRRLTIDVNFEC